MFPKTKAVRRCVARVHDRAWHLKRYGSWSFNWETSKVVVNCWWIIDINWLGWLRHVETIQDISGSFSDSVRWTQRAVGHWHQVTRPCTWLLKRFQWWRAQKQIKCYSRKTTSTCLSMSMHVQKWTPGKQSKSRAGSEASLNFATLQPPPTNW